MPRYVAFLRAINVGGHTVKMAQLRQLFEAMGFSRVESFIASGNVIFDAPTSDSQALEKQIEASLHEALGYEVATFVRTTAEVARIAHHRPFDEVERSADGATLYVAFVAEAPSDEAKQKLLAFPSEVDAFHTSGREVYWLCRTRLSESKVSGALLEKTLGMPATLRNANTVRRIAAKYA